MMQLEHRKQRGWLERMLTWNSQASIAFDVIFGIAPATIFLLFCCGALMVAVSTYRSDPQNETVRIYILTIPGITTSLSLLYTSTFRHFIKFKMLMAFSLTLGLLCAAYMTYFLGSQPQFQDDVLSFLLPVIPISLVAIKHIIVLTRIRGLA